MVIYLRKKESVRLVRTNIFFIILSIITKFVLFESTLYQQLIPTIKVWFVTVEKFQISFNTHDP